MHFKLQFNDINYQLNNTQSNININEKIILKAIMDINYDKTPSYDLINLQPIKQIL